MTFFTVSISKFCLPGLLFIRLNNQTKQNLKMHLIRRRSLLQGIRPPLNQPQPLWRRRRGMNLVLGQLRAGMREDEVWGPCSACQRSRNARVAEDGKARASGVHARLRPPRALQVRRASREMRDWRKVLLEEELLWGFGHETSRPCQIRGYFLFVLLFHPSISLSLPFLNSLFLTGFIFISMLIHPFSLAVYASSANESHLSAGSRVPARRSASAMPSRGTSCWWA